MQCKAICNLSEYPINTAYSKKQLIRAYRNSIQLADYLIGDTFTLVLDAGCAMVLQSNSYAKEIYIVSECEKQCFEFE